MLPCILALMGRRKGPRLPRSVDEAGGEGDVAEEAPPFNRCKLALLGHTPFRFVLLISLFSICWVVIALQYGNIYSGRFQIRSGSFPDPGSGAFFTPGSGIWNRYVSGSLISDPGSQISDPGSQTHTFESIVTIF
jgi:hypothetical protein